MRGRATPCIAVMSSTRLPPGFTPDGTQLAAIQGWSASGRSSERESERESERATDRVTRGSDLSRVEEAAQRFFCGQCERSDDWCLGGEDEGLRFYR